ncbi:MAG: SDR family oxidoreductase [Nitriliruptoraceae bacterium]
MQVLVIGTSKGTGNLLVRQLLGAGHAVRAMVRDPAQRPALAELGAEVVVGDLEGDLDGVVPGVDAVAFCAGSGSATGPDATLRVDLHGAVRIIDACVEAGVHRYVQLSSMAAHDPLQGPPAIRHYLAAMHARDRILVASGLDATIVRPGGLTNDPGTGRVRFGVPTLGERGSIPRADVAGVLAACLEEPATIGATFELIGGDTPIADAIAEVARAGRST